MLDTLYVFHSSGKLLFSKNWKGDEGVQEDPVLVSGFLSAIWMFAQKIGSKGVRSIQTENNVLVGVSSPTYNLLFVLVADLNADISACKNLLSRIRQSFLQKFRKQLKTSPDFLLEDCDDWSQNLESICDNMDVTPVHQQMKRFLKDIIDKTTTKDDND